MSATPTENGPTFGPQPSPEGEMTERMVIANDRYLAALHAMQSGVAFCQARGATDGTPKHLRVGVNASMTDLGSLVRLLVAKGLISWDEYMEALADGMEAEVRRYEKHIIDEHGVTVKLA